jgi:hypothetical protein
VLNGRLNTVSVEFFPTNFPTKATHSREYSRTEQGQAGMSRNCKAPYKPFGVGKLRASSACCGNPLLEESGSLSRQRSRVRVPSSPPFIPKEIGEFCPNHRGREKGAFRALSVPFFLCAGSFLSGKESSTIRTARKD